MKRVVASYRKQSCKFGYEFQDFQSILLTVCFISNSKVGRMLAAIHGLACYRIANPMGLRGFESLASLL